MASAIGIGMYFLSNAFSFPLLVLFLVLCDFLVEEISLCLVLRLLESTFQKHMRLDNNQGYSDSPAWQGLLGACLWLACKMRVIDEGKSKLAQPPCTGSLQRPVVQ